MILTYYLFLSGVYYIQISSVGNNHDPKRIVIRLRNHKISKDVISCMFSEISRMRRQNSILFLPFHPPETNILFTHRHQPLRDVSLINEPDLNNIKITQMLDNNRFPFNYHDPWAMCTVEPSKCYKQLLFIERYVYRYNLSVASVVEPRSLEIIWIPETNLRAVSSDDDFLSITCYDLLYGAVLSEHIFLFPRFDILHDQNTPTAVENRFSSIWAEISFRSSITLLDKERKRVNQS